MRWKAISNIWGIPMQRIIDNNSTFYKRTHCSRKNRTTTSFTWERCDRALVFCTGNPACRSALPLNISYCNKIFSQICFGDLEGIQLHYYGENKKNIPGVINSKFALAHIVLQVSQIPLLPLCSFKGKRPFSVFKSLQLFGHLDPSPPSPTSLQSARGPQINLDTRFASCKYT